jgi:hypothetical protein
MKEMVEMHLVLRKIKKEEYTEKSKEVIILTEILIQIVAHVMKPRV